MTENISENNITSEFNILLNNLSSFKSQIVMLQNRVKGIEKHVRKELRSLERKIHKSKNKGSRKPSGFAVPTKISKELCVSEYATFSFMLSSKDSTSYKTNGGYLIRTKAKGIKEGGVSCGSATIDSLYFT